MLFAIVSSGGSSRDSLDQTACQQLSSAGSSSPHQGYSAETRNSLLHPMGQRDDPTAIARLRRSFVLRRRGFCRRAGSSCSNVSSLVHRPQCVTRPSSSVLAIVAEQMAVWVSDRVTVTAANLPVLLAMMFCGPHLRDSGRRWWWACGAAGESEPSTSRSTMAPTSRSRRCLGRSAFSWCAQFWLTGSATESVRPRLLAGALRGTCVYEVVNIFLHAGSDVRLAYGHSLRELLATARSFRSSSRSRYWQALGLRLPASTAEAGIVSVVLLFVPLFASQYMFKLLIREREHLAEEKKLSDQYLEMNIGLAGAMVVLLDSKDEYTASHSAAVAMYCRDMARAVGMAEEEVEEIHVAGLLHDLGKVGTPDAILRQGRGPHGRGVGASSASIRRRALRCCLISPRTATSPTSSVRTTSVLTAAATLTGLRADAIPEASKILAVADSYHAITSDRPYRKARSSFEALKELRAGRRHDARARATSRRLPKCCATRISPTVRVRPPTSWASSSAAGSTCGCAMRP